MLWATFWVAACCSSWALAAFEIKVQNPSLTMTFVSLGLLTPFIAIGALLGRTTWGLLAGAIFLLLVVTQLPAML